MLARRGQIFLDANVNKLPGLAWISVKTVTRQDAFVGVYRLSCKTSSSCVN